MKFAEFMVGQVFTVGPASLDADEIVDFARRYDPQWFHVDPAAAARGRWGGVIASGWQTCGLAMRLVHEHLLAGSESIGSPGLAYLKWPAPVRPNDPLTLRVEVVEARRSRRKPDLGVLRWRWRLQHLGGPDALDLEATTLFEQPR
jgi:acyl dehydratase